MVARFGEIDSTTSPTNTRLDIFMDMLRITDGSLVSMDSHIICGRAKHSRYCTKHLMEHIPINSTYLSWTIRLIYYQYC